MPVIGGGMPLHVYRVRPMLAVAFRALYRPGQWQLGLRACSEAASVDLRLNLAQALSLRDSLLAAIDTYAASPFPVSRIAPCPANSPLLLLSCDLEAPLDTVRVLHHPQKRLLAIEARGRVGGAPFLAEIWGTPEQLLALAEQIGSVCQQVRSLCPICGRPVEEESHHCQPGSQESAGV
ncbi:MAG: hypothetical protein ACUVWR_04465 [Anaerolineae bacterium]